VCACVWMKMERHIEFFFSSFFFHYLNIFSYIVCVCNMYVRCLCLWASKEKNHEQQRLIDMFYMIH
jgi:hypothetical protein